MGIEEVNARLWTCDYCNRIKLLLGFDMDPPYSWIKDDILAFCCWSHKADWYKKREKD